MLSIAWTPARNSDSTRETYVDGSSGSDANPGSASRPLKTISAAGRIAIQNYKANISSKVLIQTGTYREFISLDYPPQPTSTKITFEAVKPGTVTISGARRVDWLASGSKRRTPLFARLAVPLGREPHSSEMARVTC